MRNGSMPLVPFWASLKAMVSVSDILRVSAKPQTRLLCGVGMHSISKAYPSALRLGDSESWAKAFRPDFTDVIYGNVSTASKVKNFLMKSVEDLVEWEKMIGEFTEVELQYEANKIVKRMLPRFKHWGFRDEREFRAIFERKDEDKQGMMVRTASVVPFIEVKNENAALPIESIMIGPSPDGEFTQKSVEALLKMYGFSKVKVALSAVPFRVQV
jgi:hypothetical protein